MFNEVDKLKYKVQALNERVAEITAQYENQVADLRVALTELAMENQELKQSVEAEEDSGDTGQDDTD